MEHDLASGGATIVIEWPRQCDYWRAPPVVAFLTRHGIGTSNFDGCMHGMVGSQGGLLKKPWTIASNNPFMLRALSRKCDGSHSHDVTKGGDAKLSETYSDELV